MSERPPELSGNLPVNSAGARDSAAPRPVPTGSLVAIALASGLVAGIASWAIGEATLTAFRPPLERHEVMGQIIMKAEYHDQAAADFKNATLANALLGTMLGASLGLAGGLARGSIARGLRAATAGLILGGVLASAASLGLLPIYFHAREHSMEEFSHDLVIPLLVDGGIWMAAGLAGGIAFGFGLGGGKGRTIKAALGGSIGAALGAVLYEILRAVAFPSTKITSALPPDWTGRLLARILVTSLAGLFSAMCLSLSISRDENKPGLS